MRFYNQTHKHYAGIDLHARNLDAASESQWDDVRKPAGWEWPPASALLSSRIQGRFLRREESSILLSSSPKSKERKGKNLPRINSTTES